MITYPHRNLLCDPVSENKSEETKCKIYFNCSHEIKERKQNKKNSEERIKQQKKHRISKD